jgi:S1-C subfamily serine protease
MEARAELIAAPETTARSETLIRGNSPFAGLVVGNLSPAVSEELNLPSSASGVVALEVAGGPARRLFRKGDIIMEVNGTLIDSVQTFSDVLQSAEGFWDFAINRKGRILRMQLGG